MSFKNVSNASASPFGDVYKTLIKVFFFLPHKISTEGNYTSVLFILRSGRSLKFIEFFILIETPTPFPQFLT